MEFMSRGRSDMPTQPAAHAPVPAHPQRPKRRLSFGIKLMRAEMFTLLLGAALLLVAVALYAGLASPNAENKQINGKQYQAVFLNNGQVYFGKITELNGSYVIIKSVFYIENNSSTGGTTAAQNSNYTLRKLGTTELHAPEDKMIINRDQITFWENLKDSGQVTSKINEYYKNPTGTGSTTPTGTTPTSPQNSSNPTSPSTTPTTPTPSNKPTP